MLNRLPLKKEYLLVAAALVLLWICYELAFQRTFAAWQLHTQLKTELTQATDVSYQPGFLKRKNNNLSKIISLYQVDSIAFRSNTIAQIAALAENEGAKLSSVPNEKESYHAGNYIIQQLEFEGESFALIRLLNSLQKADKIGFVRSVDFKVKENRSNQDAPKKLVMVVFLEVVK